ncbi:MAG: hypothetical protein FWD68_20600 [Alphaproteobacteria bacterium]|nr:hypothetical protein [Alphaproteobacteria bacterium]
MEAKERAKALELQIEERILPLGYLRLHSLQCTFSHSPKYGHYFAPPEGADVFIAYRNHAIRIWKEFAADTSDPLEVVIFSLPRLLSGDLDTADLILDNLPEQPFTQRGAGYCLGLSIRATAAVLPMPEALKDEAPRTWLAGSQRQADLRAWLNEHRHRLRWDDKECVYRAT